MASSCDVFINDRGLNVKDSFGRQLYHSFQELGFRAFLDSHEMEVGAWLPSSIEDAIRSASVQIVIFSKGYAESAWCLEELALILQTHAKFIPVFYDVEPSDLHYIQEGAYADSFAKFKEKGVYLDKLEEWKEALQKVSLMTPYSDFNKRNHSSYVLRKRLVHKVSKEMEKEKALHIANIPSQLDEIVENENRQPLDVAKYLVGLDKLVEDFEMHRGHHESNVIGIFGIGGSGKTTLAKQLFKMKCSDYDGSCFLFDVRDTELASLKSKLDKDLFGEAEGVPKVEGRKEIRGRFLIVLDDIDHEDHFESLLRPRDFLSSGSLIIVTSRDERVLIRAGIVHRYSIKQMNAQHSRKLFCFHAFHRPEPASGYEDLVNRFVTACGGLPLSLVVLGGHLFGCDQDSWELELDKVHKNFPVDIKHMLKISIDALDIEQKLIFMDIACFFIGRPKSMAIRIWEGSGCSSEKALQTLLDKSLVEEVVFQEIDECKELEFEDKLAFGMHAHLRDLGREMADELCSPSRVWRTIYLKSWKFSAFQNILIEANGRSLRCFNSSFDWSIGITYFLGNSCSCPETVLLWLELDLQDKLLTSIPPWIPLQNLQCLKIFNGGLKRLWHSDVQVIFQLKRLVLYGISKLEDLNSIEILHHLEDLVLSGDLLLTATLEMEGRALSDALTKLTNLKRLVLRHFTLSGELALSNGKKQNSAEPSMSRLEKIEITTVELVSKVSVCGDHCPSLKSLKISGMEDLVVVDLTSVTTLNCLKLEYCTELKTVSGINDLENLVMLYLLDCPKLQKLPSLAHMSRLESIMADKCRELKNLEGIEKLEGIKCLHLSTVNDPTRHGAVWNCVHRLERLPSIISVIGRAVEGAELALDANLSAFVEKATEVSGIPMVEKIKHTASMEKPVALSAFIVCALVVCDNESVGIEIPFPANQILMSSVSSRVPEGKWFVTIAMTGDIGIKYALHCMAQSGWMHKMENDPLTKKGSILAVREGEDPITLFKTIVAKLYDGGTMVQCEDGTMVEC